MGGQEDDLSIIIGDSVSFPEAAQGTMDVLEESHAELAAVVIGFV